MKRCMIFMFLLSALLLALCFPAQALSAPYGRGFDSEQEMITALQSYIDHFPNEHPHGADFVRVNRECGRHLEKRQVIIPRLAGFALESCSYRETSWDNGVNYCNFDFQNAEEEIGVVVYYALDAESRQDWIRTQQKLWKAKTIEEGDHNGSHYYAFRANDPYRSQYFLIIGDALVNVFDSQPFQESRIDLLHFKKTDLMLPVFVGDEEAEATTTTSSVSTTEEDIATTTIGVSTTEAEAAATPSGVSIPAAWIICGIAIALAGFAGCFIWARKRARP